MKQPTELLKEQGASINFFSNIVIYSLAYIPLKLFQKVFPKGFKFLFQERFMSHSERDAFNTIFGGVE